MKINDLDTKLYADHFYIIFLTRKIVFKEKNKEKSLNVLQTCENPDFKYIKLCLKVYVIGILQFPTQFNRFNNFYINDTVNILNKVSFYYPCHSF